MRTCVLFAKRYNINSLKLSIQYQRIIELQINISNLIDNVYSTPILLITTV